MNTYKLELTYGLIMGLATMLWIGLEFFIATELNMPQLGSFTGFFALIIPLIVIYLALKKKKARNGSLKFLHAVRSGLIIGVVAGVLGALFLLAYLYLNPDIMSGYFAYVAETMQEAGEDQQVINEALDDLATLYNPPIQALLMLAGTTVSGMIIGGLYGAILRTRHKKTA